jgi:UDP-N-acetyl-D-mannosaminuronate dehydrogenase
VGGGYDLILIATAHDEYREIEFGSFGVPVVDTRHIVREKADWLYQA